MSNRCIIWSLADDAAAAVAAVASARAAALISARFWNAGALVQPGVVVARVASDIGHELHRALVQRLRWNAHDPRLALDERSIPVLPGPRRAKRSSPSRGQSRGDRLRAPCRAQRGDHLVGLDLARGSRSLLLLDQ